MQTYSDIPYNFDPDAEVHHSFRPIETDQDDNINGSYIVVGSYIDKTETIVGYAMMMSSDEHNKLSNDIQHMLYVKLPEREIIGEILTYRDDDEPWYDMISRHNRQEADLLRHHFGDDARILPGISTTLYWHRPSATYSHSDLAPILTWEESMETTLGKRRLEKHPLYNEEDARLDG